MGDADGVAVGEHGFGHFGDFLGVIDEAFDGFGDLGGGRGRQNRAGGGDDFLQIRVDEERWRAGGLGLDQSHAKGVKIVGIQDIKVRFDDFGVNLLKRGGAVKFNI